MVQPSHRVHVSRQRFSDSGPKEEKRSEWIIALALNLFRLVSFWFGLQLHLLFSFFLFFLALFLQIIEKRRRDRINHSLSELRRLVPSAFEKQVKHSFELPRIFFTIRQWNSHLYVIVLLIKVLLIFPAGLIKVRESRDSADDSGPPQTAACHGRKRWEFGFLLAGLFGFYQIAFHWKQQMIIIYFPPLLEKRKKHGFYKTFFMICIYIFLLLLFSAWVNQNVFALQDTLMRGLWQLTTEPWASGSALERWYGTSAHSRGTPQTL